MVVQSEYMSEEFKEILQSFLSSKKNKRTKTEYLGYIRILCDNFIKKDFLMITQEDAASAFHNMQERIRKGTLSYKTVCVRLSCYNALSRFICQEYPEYEFKNPFRDIERPVVNDKVSPAKIPSLEELDRIMGIAKENLMYYFILALTTRCGLTASQIVKLTKSNFFEEGNKMGLYLPNYERETKSKAILLPSDVMEIAKQYISSMIKIKVDEEEHLFYNKRGNVLTLKNLSDNISDIVEQANVEFPYTMKDMRSRAILDLVEAGASEDDVQQYMGIGSMRTRQFFEAKGMVNRCPVELVNYKLKTS